MMPKKIHTLASGLLLAMLVVLLSLPTPLRAGEALVSGQYLRGGGQDIQLQITVSRPAPSTLIVIQNLPAGTVIDAATPAFHQYDASTGEAKWLLTRISPGKYTLNLRLVRPVASGAISGEIRYKDPAGGRLIQLQVRP